MYPSWFDHTTWGSKRWKTAITRKTLSVPMRLALERGVICKYEPVLDFGSGKGFDVSHLAQHGIPVTGFDPYYNYCPQVIRPYPIIACNFVLNVIEDEAERADVLRYLWALTQASLILGVRIGGDRHEWTSIGTFQQYYTQATWRSYIAKVLGVVRVEYPASGIAFIRR
jgi:DNA phosphorothioation-associated putative methyltransferase